MLLHKTSRFYYPKINEDICTDCGVCVKVCHCQVADFCSYVGHGREKLYTADVLCHGIMSPKLWEEYLGYITSKHGEIKQADFVISLTAARYRTKPLLQKARKFKRIFFIKFSTKVYC